MNSYAGRAFAVVIAVLMVIALSMTANVVVEAKATGSAYTVSTSEDIIEIEEKGCYAALDVTELGVVHYGEMAC